MLKLARKFRDSFHINWSCNEYSDWGFESFPSCPIPTNIRIHIFSESCLLNPNFGYICIWDQIRIFLPESQIFVRFRFIHHSFNRFVSSLSHSSYVGFRCLTVTAAYCPLNSHCAAAWHQVAAAERNDRRAAFKCPQQKWPDRYPALQPAVALLNLDINIVIKPAWKDWGCEICLISLPSGCFCVLLGPSGSLLSCLNGLCFHTFRILRINHSIDVCMNWWTLASSAAVSPLTNVPVISRVHSEVVSDMTAIKLTLLSGNTTRTLCLFVFSKLGLSAMPL